MPADMSMSMLAPIALAPASASLPATPCIRSSATAFQSLTTRPCQPQRSRSKPRTSARLAVTGMPPIVLKAVMNEPAPAVTARQLDPSGERPLKSAKVLRRQILREGARRDVEQLRATAHEHFALPRRPASYWASLATKLPWHLPAKPRQPLRLRASG